MNRIKIIALSMLAMAVVFSSCKKEDPDDPLNPITGPSLTVSPEEVTGWVGDAVTINYTISTASDNEIISIDISTSETEITPEFLEDDVLDDNLVNRSFEFTMPAGPAGNAWEDGDFFTVYFVATHVVDGTQYTTNKSVVCTYVAPTDPLTEYTGAMINNVIGPSTGAWDLVDNLAVSSAASNDPMKDMRNTTTLSSSAPEIFETEWDSPAGSTFVLTALTPADYANITPADLVAQYDAGTAVSTVSDVQEQQVYIAELRGSGVYTAILITEVNVTTTDNGDFISFVYKK